MKYPIKNHSNAFFLYPQSDARYLFGFGRGKGHDLCLCNEVNKHLSFCCQNNLSFDYHNIQNAVMGKSIHQALNRNPKDCFIPKRILVFEMI